MRTPKTDAEWRSVAALAEALLCIDSAATYGLITGGPKINVERCEALLEAGRARGIVPTSTEVDMAMAVIILENKALREEA